MFEITKPDVYKNPTSESYIIFGEAKVVDLRAKDAELQMQQRAAGGDPRKQQGDTNSRMPPNQQPASQSAPVAGEEDVDEVRALFIHLPANFYYLLKQARHFFILQTGFDAKDIELVVSQAGCSRGQAVKALKNNDSDIVNAIMELTM